MAINRALMNRQMYNMGGPSLQAGAPDITLTGDMRPTYSAMRKQRMAYGGIAGADGRKKYGIGSWFQENVMDPIKENPITSAVIGGGLLNQFGLPDFVTDNVDFLSDNFGQNFLGDLISKVPGVPDDLNLVIGDDRDLLGRLITGAGGDPNQIMNETDATDYLSGGGGQNTVDQMLGYSDYFPSLGTTGNNITDQIKQAVTNQALQSVGLSPVAQRDAAGNVTYEQKQRDLNSKLMKAIAAGTAAGAYVDSQPKDTIPADTTGINFQTAQQVMDDPNQRFKPPVEATQLAANGGRIGYDMGGDVMMASHEGNTQLLEQLYEDFIDMGFSPKDAAKKAQEAFDDMTMKQKPNRTMAQEGGLMDLGGMEKDYREEGGFVPIGGREKADDVPARLSKNEFVFTADAVRNAGGGDIDQGAQVMEKLMRNLESGGQVSEESQGLDGAREMFETSQRLEKRII